MLREKNRSVQLSEFLRYLATQAKDDDRLPALAELSHELGVSVASLREQLEVARALGVVEVRPKTGIRKQRYSFSPAVRQSLYYAALDDIKYFNQFSEYRSHIETAYWYEAVSLLTTEDHDRLSHLVKSAQEKLSGVPVQIPHYEHRELHLSIFRRLNNPFVMGTLEAYWDLYEATGLDVYTDLRYLNQVWQYHQKMVDALRVGNFASGFEALKEHFDLIYQRERPISRQKFE